MAYLIKFKTHKEQHQLAYEFEELAERARIKNWKLLNYYFIFGFQVLIYLIKAGILM